MATLETTTQKYIEDSTRFHIETDDRLTNGEIVFTGTLEECNELCIRRSFYHPEFGGVTADIITDKEFIERKKL